MIIVGLTGGIASGKSTVARMLARKGALILDADVIAREVVEPGRPAWQEIVNWLGKDYLKDDRSLNRQRIARLIFNDPAARQKLNRIIHPLVKKEMAERSASLKADHPSGVLVFDIPLLLEAGMQQLVDLILLTYADPEIQLKRLQERDKLSREEAEARLHAQMPPEEKRRYAHYVIDTGGTIQQTACQVEICWRALQREAGS